MSTPFAVFTTTIPFSSYVFKDGNKVQFEGSRMILRNQAYIDELRAEAENPANIFISEDTNATEENTKDPMAVLRAQIIADYEAQKAADLTSAVHDTEELKTAPVLGGIVSSQEIAAPKIKVGAAATK